MRKITVIGGIFFFLCIYNSNAHLGFDPETGKATLIHPDGSITEGGKILVPPLSERRISNHSKSVTPHDPIDQTITDALGPSSQEELTNYRKEVDNYIESYDRRDYRELLGQRNYWIGQLNYWIANPFIDGFISGPQRVEEAKLRLIALDKVLADKYAEMHGLEDPADVEGLREQLDKGSQLDKKLSKTPQEAITEKVSHYSYQEAIKWLNYWESQYKYWVNKAQQDGGVVLNDGIFNAGNQINAAVLYIKALTERINQIRQEYGYPSIKAPDVKNTDELGLSTDSFTGGTKHTPKGALSKDLGYWYSQLHVTLGNSAQTQARRDYAKGVLYMEISQLLQRYSREQVIQYLMNSLRISEQETIQLLKDIELNGTE